MVGRFSWALLAGAIVLTGACSKNSASVTEENIAVQRPASDDSDMVMVPAGEFIMGSNKVDKEGLQQEYGFEAPLYVNEHPEQQGQTEKPYPDLTFLFFQG